MAASHLRFGVQAFAVDDTYSRHLVFDRVTQTPSVLASVYEVHLAAKFDSPNTRANVLRSICEALTWAQQIGLDLERTYLSGDCLEGRQITGFADWLRKRLQTSDKYELPVKAKRHLNRTIYDVKATEAFFMRQFRAINRELVDPMNQVHEALLFQERLWEDATVKVHEAEDAPDLTDAVIAAIEESLHPANRVSASSPAIANRDYLIWRLAIEFGLRIGEILALRTEDCPGVGRPYFRIVRIEERVDKRDSRHPYAPRPKTLSRELGFIHESTRFPRLSQDYISTYRFAEKESHGRRIRKFNLGHDFLIVAEGGAPLSLKSASDIAKKIRSRIGEEFHWHLARHAFFNRAMDAVRRASNREEEVARRKDLCFWGGWESEASLDIYTRRVRKETAREGLTTWQVGGNAWTLRS